MQEVINKMVQRLILKGNTAGADKRKKSKKIKTKKNKKSTKEKVK